MARIAGINIPQNKVVSIALTYIHGIGTHSSKIICKKLNIPETTRVNKLSEEQVLKIREFIEIIKPRYIFLGKKDYQQLYLIKKHIKKRNIRSKIVECTTIREINGIACSSRNSNLNKKQKKIASNIYYYLCDLKKKIKKNYSLFKMNKIKKDLIDLGASKIDYLENYNIKNFKKIKKTNEKFNLFFAYYIKNIRLIDNI